MSGLKSLLNTKHGQCIWFAFGFPGLNIFAQKGKQEQEQEQQQEQEQG